MRHYYQGDAMKPICPNCHSAHVIENIDTTKIMIGIEQEAIEKTENLFMENIMKEMKIKITNKKIIEIHTEEMTIIIDKV